MTSRIGETLLMRFGGRDELVTAVDDDGSRVGWKSADGSRSGGMAARLWDLNMSRQGCGRPVEGGDF